MIKSLKPEEIDEQYYQILEYRALRSMLEPIKKDMAEGRKFIFVAIVDEKVIGAATLNLSNTFGGRKGYIVDVIVDPKHRKQGWGRKLVEACIDTAQANKCNYISLASSDKNLPWYKNIGFRVYYHHMGYWLGQ